MMARSERSIDSILAATPPIDLQASSTTTILGRIPFSNSPILDDYVSSLPVKPLKRSSTLPHKFRPMSDYELCDQKVLTKLGIDMPQSSFHNFNLYVKKKERDTAEPVIYFIKFNDANSYMSEFEAFHSGLLNLFVEGIIPSSHVIYDDTKIEKPPIGICTKFDTSFKPVKTKPVKVEDLRDREVVKSLAEIIISAFMLEEDDLHAHNFGWASHRALMRVDAGMLVWNYVKQHPKLTTLFSRWNLRTQGDRFPITVRDMEKAPNFVDAAPHYCPSGGKSLLSSGSSADSYLKILKSKNAFSEADMEVYKNPHNLQSNDDFEYHKYRLLLKSTFISKELIKECATLYLRTKEGVTELTHIDEYADHIENRLEQFRVALLKSDEFKAFIKDNNGRVMHDILDEVDAFQEKGQKKLAKPVTAEAYRGLFSSLTEESVSEKWRELQDEIHNQEGLKK